MYRIRYRPLATASALAVGLAACDAPSESAMEPDFDVVTGWERTAFDVYTQNLYLGGDTGPLFDPDVVANLPLLAQKVADFWDEVLASDVTARMGEIADHIADHTPEVVALQEGLQFIAVDLTGQEQPVVVDLLGALMAQLQARGLPYDTVVVQEATSSQLPLGSDFTHALLFTDRLAILKRGDVDVTDFASGVYAAAVPIGQGVQVRRGWARATVDHDGTIYNFVNTHLETQGAQPIHDLQAEELMSLLGQLDGVTVLAGDLNSDAAAVQGDASWTATYGRLIDEAGFSDVWALAPHARTDPGYTCCQDNNLRNASSELDQRIDFVLVRSTEGDIPGNGERRGHFRLDVIGDRTGDLTSSGLWPSDHAGLVAGILSGGR